MPQIFSLLETLVYLCQSLLLARIILGFVVQYMSMQGNRPPEVLVTIYDVVFRVTEPVLGPIRRKLPQTGTVDFSPLVVIVVLLVVQIVAQTFLKAVL